MSDLEEFCESFPEMLHRMNENPLKRGYRPRAACIDLPEQSALDFMQQLAGLSAAKIAEQKGRLRRTINSVEYRHLVKAGNNVKSLASGRVLTDSDLLGRYEGIRTVYKNPVFRATLLKALLRSPPGDDQRRWFAPFEELFRTMPKEFSCAARACRWQ